MRVIEEPAGLIGKDNGERTAITDKYFHTFKKLKL